MGRQALHTADVKIEQKAPIIDTKKYAEEGDVVIVDSSIANKDWLDEIAFGEEPVTIRIEPSSERNAATAHPVWVNGKGAEVFQNNRWDEITYLPTGRALITKRKYVAVLASAKFDRITTEVEEATVERPRNEIKRFTSSNASFSVLEDKNPKGRDWLTELIRRNM